MITKLEKFKLHLESLSSDRAAAGKLQMLIDTCKQMIADYAESDKYDALKKSANNDVKDILAKFEKSSVIASGVLIEVIQPYEMQRLDTKSYLEFVEKSVDILGNDFKTISDEMAKLATKMSDETSYLRFNQNKKFNYPTGTMLDKDNKVIKKESIGSFIDSIKDWLVNFKNKIFGLFDKTEQDVNNIKAELIQFQNNKHKFPNELIASLKNNENKTNEGNILCKIAHNWSKPYIDKDYNEDFNITMRHCKRCGQQQESKNMSNKPDFHDIKYKSKQNTVKKVNEAVEPNANDIKEILEKAKAAIDYGTKQAYYEQLARTKEATVIELLKEFKAKGIAIGDIIVSMTTLEAKPKMTLETYMDSMTNATIVNESIAEMATNLFSIHTKTSPVSGSVRQYGDDTNSPDGTFNARFDYVNKKVELEQDRNKHESLSVTESWLNDIWDKVKNFFKSFRRNSRNADVALEKLKIVLT